MKTQIVSKPLSIDGCTAQQLYELADAKQEEADNLKRIAREQYRKELEQTPLLERLVFAAFSRCICGCGMAYDPAGESGKPIHGFFECSAKLLGFADYSIPHSEQLPFTMYSVLTERQPRANGATTRPAPERNHKGEVLLE